MSGLRPVRGTHDLLPEGFRQHKYVIDTACEIAERYGFDEMMPPVFEFTHVFSRTMGQTSDVVTKEMYTFPDRSGEENITLRPEFTAGICRAFASNSLYDQVPFKVFACGPLFRYERPQKGRQRQFHQIDAEIIGVKGPQADIEVLSVGQHILEELEVAKSVTLRINSLGDAESREFYREKLVAYLEPFGEDLSEDSRQRLHHNPLRIFDSKSERDIEIITDAPLLRDHLNYDSQKFFGDVCDGLSGRGIAYTIDPGLVRGLDYYTHTAFEFVTESLGAQGTVIAGGRYDGLIEQLGGRPTPGIGWAGGVERLAMMVGNIRQRRRPVALVPIGGDACEEANIIAQKLRKAGFMVALDYSGGMKRRLARANKANAVIAILIGDDELKRGIVTIRDMENGEQHEKPLNNLANHLAQYR
ncbi:MAG: histidine--tRNA ligase [Rhodospirillaceae bacterium TMED8]|nr:histidine--tRNA ligase [Magnetovibrio sp.]OUT53277.1 MAG: histidine--tRNA ligase [Rhodospirillaceae bacterium TMED8]